MIFQRERLNLDTLYDVLQTPFGLTQLAIVVLSIVVGACIALFVFRRYQDVIEAAQQRFLPYIGFRLLAPAVALVLLIIALEVMKSSSRHSVIMLHLGISLMYGMIAIRICCAALHQAIGHEALTGRSEQALSMVLWIAFAIWMVELDVVVLDWLESISLTIGSTHLNLLRIITGLIWLGAIFVVASWVSRTIEERLMNLQQLDISLRAVFAKIARVAILVLAVLIALPMLGIDLTVLSVFGGALGIGLGFGLQKIASNFLSGFIILFERSTRIGDRVIIDSRAGTVTRMTSRYIVLRTADGTEALIPNDTLISSTVVNQTYSDNTIMTHIAVSVAYGTDLDQALSLLLQAAKHPRVLELNGKTPDAYIVSFGDSAINLELYFWVADPENGMLGLKSDINLQIWRLFQAHNIQMPFPQCEVRLLGDTA